MTAIDCFKQITVPSCDNYTKCVRKVLIEGGIKPDNTKGCENTFNAFITINPDITVDDLNKACNSNNAVDDICNSLTGSSGLPWWAFALIIIGAIALIAIGYWILESRKVNKKGGYYDNKNK